MNISKTHFTGNLLLLFYSTDIGLDTTESEPCKFIFIDVLIHKMLKYTHNILGTLYEILLAACRNESRVAAGQRGIGIIIAVIAKPAKSVEQLDTCSKTWQK